MREKPDFSKDLLRGAEEIAEYLFGDPGQRRKVYHLSTNSNLPTFKLGSMICARRSKIDAWIEAQERKKTREPVTEELDTEK